MSLLSQFFGKEKEIEMVPEKKPSSVTMSMMPFTRPEQPLIIDNKSHDYVTYGADNLYPNKLAEYRTTSSIHNAILIGKAQMMAGKGLLFGDSIDETSNNDFLMQLDIETRTSLNNLLNETHTENIYKIMDYCSLDWQIYGAFALEIIWSMDHTRIIEVKYINVNRIRSGKLVNGEVLHYFYCRDWSKKQNHEIIKFQAFNEEVTSDYNQILYVKRHNPNNDYYGEPAYVGAITYIETDSSLGLFHLSNVRNGFNPSMTIHFFGEQPTPEEKRMTENAMKNQFQGIHNTGKAMMIWDQDKDHKTEINPIQTQNLDKMFISLAEQCTQQILTGHRVTNPLIFGISVPGKLGGEGEMEASYLLYDNTVIEPDRIVLQDTINKILKINFDNLQCKIMKFNPFKK